jgi:hypothetical protein
MDRSVGRSPVNDFDATFAGAFGISGVAVEEVGVYLHASHLNSFDLAFAGAFGISGVTVEEVGVYALASNIYGSGVIHARGINSVNFMWEALSQGDAEAWAGCLG